MQKVETVLGILRAAFVKVFHKRSLIILSEKKVRHIHISGAIQFALVLAMAGGVCWSSYSTGSFMAARSTIREQDETIRSVTGNKVESNFNTMLSASVQPSSRKPATYRTMLSDSTLALTMSDHRKLFERISYLESRVAELKSANDSIIQTVRSKTGGQIGDLERIIRSTGLNPEMLKRQAMSGVKRAPKPPSATAGPESGPDEDAIKDEDASATPAEKSSASAGHQGGPFIPVDSEEYYQEQAKEISVQLDQLMALGSIVQALPLARPIDNGEPRSGFGRRIDPFTGRLAFHAGFDVSGPSGTNVRATGDGVVTFAGRSGAYGQVVDIDHGLGISTRYGHLRKITVTEGQRVAVGDAIGVQGSTGRSTGEHVHYEVRFNDKPLNPRNFLEATNVLLQN